MINSISSNSIIIFMKIFFHQSHYCGHRLSDLVSQIPQDYFSLSRSIDSILITLYFYSGPTIANIYYKNSLRSCLCVSQTPATSLPAVIPSQVKGPFTQLQHRDNHWWLIRNSSNLSMVMFSTSCSLTTTHTHRSISLYCRLKTHPSKRKLLLLDWFWWLQSRLKGYK